MKNDKLWQFLVVLSIISVLVVNYLSTAVPFGGQTNATVSDKYHTYFTPAGYAFSIWGLIYLGLLAFAVYQAFPSQRENYRFREIRPWVVANGVLNCIWLPLFQNELFSASVAVILGMVFTLMLIMEGLQVNRKPVSVTETGLSRIPFSLYFGWITVATIANAAVWLKATGFGGYNLAEPTWSVIMIIIGLFVGAFVFNRYRSVAYILVFTWAYTAIAVEQSDYYVQVVAGAGAIGAVLLAIAGVISRKTPAYT
ncbi:tryptophan-rich sensory protein [Nibrella viscosa]|uniref:Tryptophan-rich sensory protein n=1 Tax=Nibrella viscosa TaxID=1084524 RepID=A0ABP8KR15_9BACT